MQKGRTYTDYTNYKFGKLTILPNSREVKETGKWRIVTYQAQCECGVIKRYQLSNIKQRPNGGCGTCVNNRGQFRKKPEGVAATNMVLRYYKSNTTKRGLIWLLTNEQFKELIHGNCKYCGQSKSMTAIKHKDTIQYNGIDRVNNEQGYSSDNCVSCCKTCNTAKASMSLEDFYAWIARVYKHSFI